LLPYSRIKQSKDQFYLECLIIEHVTDTLPPSSHIAEKQKSQVHRGESVTLYLPVCERTRQNPEASRCRLGDPCEPYAESGRTEFRGGSRLRTPDRLSPYRAPRKRQIWCSRLQGEHYSEINRLRTTVGKEM